MEPGNKEWSIFSAPIYVQKNKFDFLELFQKPKRCKDGPTSFHRLLAWPGRAWAEKFWVYRHLGDFSLRRGPVGESATWGKCQLGDQNLTFGR